MKAVQPVTFQLATAAWPIQLSRAYCCCDDIPTWSRLPFRHRKPEPSAAKTAKPEHPVSAQPLSDSSRRHKIGGTIIGPQPYMRQSGAVFKPHARGANVEPLAPARGLTAAAIFIGRQTLGAALARAGGRCIARTMTAHRVASQKQSKNAPIAPSRLVQSGSFSCPNA